jgi:hypothetical protein
MASRGTWNTAVRLLEITDHYEFTEEDIEGALILKRMKRREAERAAGRTSGVASGEVEGSGEAIGSELPSASKKRRSDYDTNAIFFGSKCYATAQCFDVTS